MKYLFFCLSISLISCQSKSQDRIKVHIPSAQEEAEYIWRTLQDIAFFEEHNYQISLPKGALIQELAQKVKDNRLSDQDYPRLEQFVLDSVYHQEEYQKGYDKIQEQLALLNKMVNEIDASAYDWSFKEYETYTVNLTLYGPGGSFNPDEGSILVFTTPQGQFKNYSNPANTIIHEIVHIGIDASIIAAHNVPHALKERIVDYFVSQHFGQYLSDYRIQDMGEYRTDSHLQTRDDFKKLDAIVQQVLSQDRD